VDRDGEFYADANSLGFIDNKPSKGAVDRLVGDLKKAEDARMRRQKGGDEEDVTYINDKNKQFNQKLARYYNKVCSANILFISSSLGGWTLMRGFSILGRLEIALREVLWFRNGTVVRGTGLSGVMETTH